MMLPTFRKFSSSLFSLFLSLSIPALLSIKPSNIFDTPSHILLIIDKIIISKLSKIRTFNISLKKKKIQKWSYKPISILFKQKGSVLSQSILSINVPIPRKTRSSRGGAKRIRGWNAIPIDDTAECASIGWRDNAHGIPRASLHARRSWVRKVLSFSRKERRRKRSVRRATRRGAIPANFIPRTLPRNYFPDKSFLRETRGIKARCITGYHPPEKAARENPPYLPRPFEAILVQVLVTIWWIYIYKMGRKEKIKKWDDFAYTRSSRSKNDDG